MEGTSRCLTDKGGKGGIEGERERENEEISNFLHTNDQFNGSKLLPSGDALE